MQSLYEYLASAPKSHLAKLHRRDHPTAGLQQSARVIEGVQARALDPDRLQEVLANSDREARRLLLAVYAAEERGLFETELQRGCPTGPSQASYFLAGLEYELLVFSRESESRSYHGFRELAPMLLPALLAEFAPVEAGPPSGAWVSNAAHGLSHFCHFLAKAARGELRLTQAKELHRKSLQDLAQGFSSGHSLSDAAAEEETVFLFRFGAEAELWREDDGILRLSEAAEAWLEEGRAEWRRRLWEWWLRRRVRGLSRTLAALAQMENAPAPAHAVGALAPIFSVYEGWESTRGKSVSELSTWENLPRTLRELWMIGGVDFAMHKGRIRWVRLRNPEEGVAGAPDPTEAPRGLPNLEALVPVSVPLRRQFQVELVAGRANDEVLTRYRFTKDSVVQGLQAGMTAEALQELAAWLGFEAPARRTLSDWAAAYVTAVFREIFVLRVRDPERFRELQEFPHFMELVTETIPDYGFVLARADKARARELLRVFDLLPGEEASPEADRGQTLALEAADPQWALPAFPHGEIAYRHALPLRRELPSLGERERGARARAEATVADRMQVLEGAIRLQKTVEFTYNGAVGKRIQVQPLHVLRNRDPIKLIAVELGSGHRNEYLLDQVQGLHLVEAG